MNARRPLEDLESLKTELSDSLQKAQILEAQNRVLKSKNIQLRKLLLEQSQRRKKIEKRLSIHPQTGLPTHYRMNTDLVGLIEEARTDDQVLPFALIIMQLNQSYEMIKKTLKSSISEWVLYQFASRLKENISLQDKIFHTRENEFILAIFGRPRENLESFLKKLVMRVQEPHIFSGFNLSLTCSMGVALFPDHGTDKGLLLHNADIALGAAQEQNKSIVFFREELRETVIERMELQNSIIKAIEAPAIQEIDHQFEIYLQPKIEIAGISGNEIIIGRIDAEALIRWHHPTKGLISPGKFIPIAEETGLIMPIGKWSIFQIMKRMQYWKDQGIEDVGVSVNISPRQFKSGELVEIFVRLLDQYPIDTNRLTIELTETSLFEDPYQAISVIDELKKMGFKISVDDFGTGYSSLSHLHKFPLDEIKIDQTFIKEFPHNKQDKAIVGSLAAIAKELKLKLVAEGVEKSSQLLQLTELGCQTIQGFYFCRPLPEDEFFDFCKTIEDAGMRFPLTP